MPAKRVNKSARGAGAGVNVGASAGVGADWDGFDTENVDEVVARRIAFQVLEALEGIGCF